MATEKISAMPSAVALDGTELLPIIQAGVNKKATAGLFGQQFAALQVSNLLFGLQSPNVQNANYTLAFSDIAGIIEHNDNTSSYTWTIPPSSSVSWPTTYTPHIKFLNNSAQIITIAPGAGVTLTRADGASGTGTRIMASNSSALIYLIASNSWIIEGTSLA